MAKTRDTELARLLTEVRALRGELEVLKRNPVIRDALGAAADLPPNYAVLVRPGPDRGAAGELPPNYAVLVRPGPDLDARLDLPPNYAVLVRPVDRDAVILPGVFERTARTTARKATTAKATVKAATRKAKPRKPK